MSIDFSVPNYIFVIDTETYAGSFERTLTATVTGIYGDCGVGDEEAEAAQEKIPPEDYDWFDEHVMQVPDENGCARPTYIWPTPGWENNGNGQHRKVKGEPKYLAYLSVAIFMNEKPSLKIQGGLIDRAQDFARAHKIKITGFRLLKATQPTFAEVAP